MTQIFDLLTGNAVTVLTDSEGREYAQLSTDGSRLDDNPVTSPTSPATVSDTTEQHNEDWEYELRGDRVVFDANVLKYWGVVDKREK